MLMPETEPPKQLQRAEVDAALDRLVQDAGEMARAKKLARIFARGLPGMNAEDLLQQTFTLLLEGKRQWPRGLTTLKLFQGVMRSIASNTRKKPDYVLASDLGNPSNEDYEYASLSLSEGRGPETDPVSAVEAASYLATVQNAVKGDEELELLVEALAEGLTGMGIAKELGWEGKKYDAARNRLSRRLAVLKTDWSKP